MKKVIVMGILVMMIAGIWTYFWGCGDTLPRNLANADDEDLCMTLRVCIDERKIPEYINPNDMDFSQLTEDEYKFFILSDFDNLFQCGGLVGYISNTDGVHLDEIEPLLRDFELDEMADVYASYFESHDIDFADFSSDAYDFEQLAEMYDTDTFDDVFYACYEENNLTKILADYARETFLDEYQKWIYEE